MVPGETGKVRVASYKEIFTFQCKSGITLCPDIPEKQFLRVLQVKCGYDPNSFSREMAYNYNHLLISMCLKPVWQDHVESNYLII